MSNILRAKLVFLIYASIMQHSVSWRSGFLILFCEWTGENAIVVLAFTDSESVSFL